jgi:threonine 3-dehydrogenase
MLAFAKIAPEINGLALCQREVRKPDAGEVLLKLSAAGICGSDIQIYKWAPRYVNWIKLPRIIGHEMSGVVTELGAGVTNVKVGDHVSLESHIPCGQCYQCRTNRAHICPDTRYPGIQIDGVFAEYVTVPAEIAWVNPPEVPERFTAVLEPFGIAVHATLEGSGVAGQSVLINGCGPIGLMNVAVARYFGAHTVIGVDPNPLRRKTAQAMGADCTIDPAEQDVARVVKDMTAGRGADVVFEYTGQPAGVKNCFASVTMGGDIRWCATPPHAMEFDFNMMRVKRPTIYNIHGRRLWETWVVAAPLIYDQRVDISPVLTHTLPLSEAPRAFELVLSGQAGKPILVPD